MEKVWYSGGLLWRVWTRAFGLCSAAALESHSTFSSTHKEQKSKQSRIQTCKCGCEKRKNGIIKITKMRMTRFCWRQEDGNNLLMTNLTSLSLWTFDRCLSFNRRTHFVCMVSNDSKERKKGGIYTGFMVRHLIFWCEFLLWALVMILPYADDTLFVSVDVV
jgi:hypothetical protein